MGDLTRRKFDFETTELATQLLHILRLSLPIFTISKFVAIAKIMINKTENCIL